MGDSKIRPPGGAAAGSPPTTRIAMPSLMEGQCGLIFGCHRTARTCSSSWSQTKATGNSGGWAAELATAWPRPSKTSPRPPAGMICGAACRMASSTEEKSIFDLSVRV